MQKCINPPARQSRRCKILSSAIQRKPRNPGIMTDPYSTVRPFDDLGCIDQFQIFCHIIDQLPGPDIQSLHPVPAADPQTVPGRVQSRDLFSAAKYFKAFQRFCPFFPVLPSHTNCHSNSQYTSDDNKQTVDDPSCLSSHLPSFRASESFITLQARRSTSFSS